MFCTNCGAKLSDQAEFCTSCGKKIQPKKPADSGMPGAAPKPAADVQQNMEQQMHTAPQQNTAQQMHTAPQQNTAQKQAAGPYAQNTMYAAGNAGAPTEKKSKAPLVIGLVAGIILALAILGVVLYFLVFAKSDEDKGSKGKNSAQTSQADKDPTDDKNAASEKEESGKDDSEKPAAEIDYYGLYSDYIDSHFTQNDEPMTYQFLYVTDDDIPELVIYGNCEAAGTSLLYIVDGEVYSYLLERLGFTYVERGNLFCASNGVAGTYFDRVYTLNGSRVTLVADGEYWIDQFSEMEQSVYEWNGSTVSAYEYYKSLYDTYGCLNTKYASAYETMAEAKEKFESGTMEITDLNVEEPKESDFPEESSEYLLPEINSRYYSDDDFFFIQDKQTFRLALNELYARHGRTFRDAELQKYFEGFAWYEGVYEPDEFDAILKRDKSSLLNDYEIANEKTLILFGEEKGYR